MKYVKVILPLSLKELTYRVPDNLEAAVFIGVRVEVELGKKKHYSGIVSQIMDSPEDETIKYKPVISILDKMPILHQIQLRLWNWMADYYMCSTGEVMTAALPAAFKLSSETSITLHPSFQGDYTALNDDEFTIAEALSNTPALSLADVVLILEHKQTGNGSTDLFGHQKNDKKEISLIKAYTVLEHMMEHNIVLINEELIERYRPRLESFVRLHPDLQGNDAAMKDVFDRLERRAPNQLNLLMTFLHLQNAGSRNKGEQAAIKKRDLLIKANVGDAALNSLVTKNILEIVKQEVSRLADLSVEEIKNFQLTPAQQKALEEIESWYQSKEVVLLHGATSSGKTLIYTSLIQKALAEGKQVLYLLPEIALTEQLIRRLQIYFGDAIGIYHSKYSQHQRIEIWNGVLQQRYKIVVGARSAVFLPFAELGLIVVDEEHDASFKQNDLAPYYHGRDTAIWLAAQFKAKVLLGSATPSIESYYNAQQKKYGLVKLPHRYADMPQPEIQLADTRDEQKMKLMKGSFTSVLFDEIKLALEKKEQVILFQNRRGYAPSLYCGVCGWVPECQDCALKLTYHKYSDSLRCHYCGFTRKVIQTCPQCANTTMKVQGFGTEKIEDELKILLPQARLARMDADSVRTKDGHNKVIRQMETGEADILIGTQMVTKGLDFDNVSLVGVLSADNILNFPDFRVSERGFQLLQQVAGRSGRKNKRGKVIVQTLNMKYPVLTYVLHHDYENFYNTEIEYRAEFNYPPFCRLIQVQLKHPKPERVEAAAQFLEKLMRPQLKDALLGPAKPGVERLKGNYIQEFLLKPARNANTTAKNILKNALLQMAEEPKLKSVRAAVVVDL